MKPNRVRILTNKEKVDLISDYKSGSPIKAIMEKYKVAHQTIYNILKQPISEYDN